MSPTRETANRGPSYFVSNSAPAHERPLAPARVARRPTPRSLLPEKTCFRAGLP